MEELTEIQKKQIKIMVHYGEDRQLEKLVEECAELIKAIMKSKTIKIITKGGGCMIYFYSGTPGSGKSLHVARDIYIRLNRNKKYPNVIANFMINQKMIRKKRSNFVYKDNSDLTVEFLLEYAFKNHKIGVENQTLVVVDECSVIWNSRCWMKDHDRMEWLKFFVQHRKLGYNFILISQTDRQIDRQIRSLFEYEIKHRKVNNFKIGQLFPFPLFIAVAYWYGVNERLGCEFFTYRRKWGKFYDSYGTFSLDQELMSLAK